MPLSMPLSSMRLACSHPKTDLALSLETYGQTRKALNMLGAIIAEENAKNNDDASNTNNTSNTSDVILAHDVNNMQIHGVSDEEGNVGRSISGESADMSNVNGNKSKDKDKDAMDMAIESQQTQQTDVDVDVDSVDVDSEPADSEVEQAQACIGGRLPLSMEFALWENRWVQNAKELSEWPLLLKIAEETGVSARRCLSL